MRPDIQQVLAMNKAGQITDEQAAALLQELLGQNSTQMRSAPKFPDPRSRERTDFGRGRCGVSDSINSLVGSVVDQMSETSEYFGRGGEADRDENRFHHSDWSAPTGTNPVFRGNQIRMSKLREIRLDQSELTETHIDASRLQELRMNHGKFTGGRLRASSLRELTIDRSEIVGLELSTSKCSEIAVMGESSLKDLRIQSSILKEIKFSERAVWENSFLDAAVWSEVQVVRSRLADCELQNSRLLETEVTDCEWKNILVRGTTFAEVHFANSRLDRVLFTGTEKWGWKKKSFSKVRFEHCHLNNVLFSDCRVAHGTIRNVTLSDLKVVGLELSNRTIDGNEAFLAAVRPYQQ